MHMGRLLDLNACIQVYGQKAESMNVTTCVYKHLQSLWFAVVPELMCYGVRMRVVFTGLVWTEHWYVLDYTPDVWDFYPWGKWAKPGCSTWLLHLFTHNHTHTYCAWHPQCKNISRLDLHKWPTGAKDWSSQYFPRFLSIFFMLILFIFNSKDIL